MCNDYRLLVDAASIAEDFADLKITIRFSEGVPNLEAREDIRITDPAPIVRTIEGVRGEGDLVQRRWSWPERNGRPVYNFRSDGREFASNRCLIVADGFYEFTDPKEPDEEAQGQVAVHQAGRADLLHRRHLARHQGRGRGLHHADHGARAGHRSRITTGRSSSWTAMPGPTGSTRRCRPRR